MYDQGSARRKAEGLVKHDARGLAISTESERVVEGVDRFTVEFMAARDAVPALFDLSEAHPDCALLQLYAAAMYLYSQSAESIERDARPHLAHAAALELNARERALLELMRAWSVGEFLRAIVLAEAIAERWPRDLIAAKLGEFLFFQAPDFQRHLAYMQRLTPALGESSAFGAMLAFALELAGHADEAERVALAAIDRDLHTPWAHHALGHVYLNGGRLDDGLAAFARFAPTWSGHVRPVSGHNWWHLALFHLYGLELERARALLGERVAGVEPDSVVEHTDEISLLWRLDLAGASTAGAWSGIAARIRARAAEQVFPFLNAHYGYALARAGDHAAARAVSAAMPHAGAALGLGGRRVWCDVGVPLVEGCIAFAEHEFLHCATLLEPIAGELWRVGGSDAQNELFTQTLVVALLESGRRADARALLEHRLRGRPPTPLEQEWLRRC